MAASTRGQTRAAAHPEIRPRSVPLPELVERPSDRFEDHGARLAGHPVPDHVPASRGGDRADLAQDPHVLAGRRGASSDDPCEVACRKGGLDQRAHDLETRELARALENVTSVPLRPRRERTRLCERHRRFIDRSVSCASRATRAPIESVGHSSAIHTAYPRRRASALVLIEFAADHANAVRCRIHECKLRHRAQRLREAGLATSSTTRDGAFVEAIHMRRDRDVAHSGPGETCRPAARDSSPSQPPPASTRPVAARATGSCATSPTPAPPATH